MQVCLPLLPALLCLAAASTSLPSRRQYQDGASHPDSAAAALLYRYSVGSSDGDYNSEYDDTKLDPLQNEYHGKYYNTVQDNNDNVDDTIRILYGRDGQVYDVDGPNDQYGLYTYSDNVEEQEEESRDEPKGFSDSFGKSGVQVHGNSYSSSHGNSQGKSSGSYGHGHAGHTYRGRYAGRCHYDGLYYHDEKSFIMCSNGNAYLQYCAPGTRNSAYNGYGHGSHGLSGGHRGHGGHGYGGYGGSYNYRDFCDVNLVDYGYAAIRSHGHQGGYGGHNRHGSRGYSVHGYSSYGHGSHGYNGHSYGYSSHHGGLNHGRGY